MTDSPEYRQLLDKARAAACGGPEAWSVQSTGEKLAVALALNRADWLASLNYTIPEALDRIGPRWAAFLTPVAVALREEGSQFAAAIEAASEAEAAAAVLSGPEVDLSGELVTYGHAPGYRDADLIFNVHSGDSRRTTRVRLRIRPQDGEPIVRFLRDVHRLAWSSGSPLDLREGELRPRWF